MMIDISQLAQNDTALSGDAYPLEKWHPELCQTMDMVIDVNGQWHHEGEVINLAKMVRLFAKILIKIEQEYFLITPGEKIAINVVDAPFVIVDFEITEPNTPQQEVWLLSNIGDRILLSAQYPLLLKGDEQRPYVSLWRGLDALISRQVYYHLIRVAQDAPTTNTLNIISKGQQFSLGSY